MEQSRPLLEESGVGIAAISYDSPEVLRGFAEKFAIGYPLLSDAGSAVIRRFGLFNPNIPSDLRAHGVPHPVDFLVSPDGTVIRKYFVPNYNHRVTASSIALREFGVSAEGAAKVTVRSGPLTVQIGLSATKAFAGEEVAFVARFTLEPGWHIYGSPLPEPYTATSVAFDDRGIIRQSVEFPVAVPARLAATDEILPVYSGSFQVPGSLLLKFPLDSGAIALSGNIRFQPCSDTVCEPPQALPFDLPLIIEPFVVATKG